MILCWFEHRKRRFELKYRDSSIAFEKRLKHLSVMRLDTTTTVVLLGTWMVATLTAGDGARPTPESDPPTTPGSSHSEEEEEDGSGSTLREKRDGYGGGGGGGSYGSGGNYGCNCPNQYCNDNSDLLLYFSAGALLGLLFSLLQGGMMMMPTPPMPPPPMMGMGGRNAEEADAVPSTPTAHLLNSLPTLLATDIAPLAMDIVKVYTESEEHPECIRRWVCELTQKSLKQGGLRARITSVSSVALSWVLKDMMPFLENMDSTEHFDCSILAHECNRAFDRAPVTYN